MDSQKIQLGCIVGGIPAFFIGLFLIVLPRASPGVVALSAALMACGGFVTSMTFWIIPIIRWRINARVGRAAEVAAARIYYADADDSVEDATLEFATFEECPIPGDVTDINNVELFRRFVRDEVVDHERVMSIGQPEQVARQCPKCGKLIRPNATNCRDPKCDGVYVPPAPREMPVETAGPLPKSIARYLNVETPETVIAEIETALSEVKAAGGITVMRGTLRVPWVRLDGEDWFERCAIVSRSPRHWAELFPGRGARMQTPWLLEGDLLEVRAHPMTLQQMCYSEDGAPVFLLRENDADLTAEARKLQTDLKPASIAIAALVALNAAENRDNAVVRERMARQEVEKKAEDWEVRYHLKRKECEEVTDANVKAPPERSNGMLIGLAISLASNAILLMYLLTGVM